MSFPALRGYATIEIINVVMSAKASSANLMRVTTLNHRNLSIKIALAVNRELIKRFPENAGQRCMYSAYALAHLLREQDREATVVGGDFAIFAPARDGKSAAFHGFGGADEPGTASHYWVESEDRLVDASTLLLHQTTNQAIVRLPIVYWPIIRKLPRYIRYVETMRAHRDAEFSTISEQRETAEAVIDGSRRRLSNKGMQTKSDVLDGPEYIVRAKAKSAWAKAAAEYEANSRYGQPPF